MSETREDIRAIAEILKIQEAAKDAKRLGRPLDEHLVQIGMQRTRCSITNTQIKSNHAGQTD